MNHRRQNPSFFGYPPDHRNFPLLHLIETENDVHHVRKLLQCGEDPNEKSREDNTPLHLAVLYPARTAIIEVLIEAGADVDAKNCYKNTPLDFAIIFRKHDVIEILLRAGAGVNHCDEIGNNPLHYAIKNCLLFKNMNSKFVCSESNKYVDFWIVEKLFQHHAIFDNPNIVGHTPLYLAVEVGSVRLVRMLLGMGASTSCRDTLWGYTPLHVALQGKKIYIPIVYELLRHGANANAKSGYLVTPWLLAVEKYFSWPWWEMDNAKTFMSAFMLFTIEYRTFRMPGPTPNTVKLYQFYHECVFEAEVMKSDVITSKYTVYDFVAHKPIGEILNEDYPERKAYDYVFHNLKKGIYVVYKEEILKRIGRSYLSEKLTKIKLSTRMEGNRESLCLDNLCVQKILLYLSLPDLFNLILAKSKYNWINTAKGTLQRNILRVLHTYAPNFMKTSIIL